MSQYSTVECDRCGRTVSRDKAGTQGWHPMAEVSWLNTIGHAVDLCPACYDLFKAFLAEKKVAREE